jgi:hypothetical protein
MVMELEPAVATAAPGELASTRYPFLRHIAAVGSDTSGAIESWDQFLKRGEATSPQLVEAMADAVAPSDPGALFFSSGAGRHFELPLGGLPHRLVRARSRRRPRRAGGRAVVGAA